MRILDDNRNKTVTVKLENAFDMSTAIKAMMIPTSTGYFENNPYQLWNSLNHIANGMTYKMPKWLLPDDARSKKKTDKYREIFLDHYHADNNALYGCDCGCGYTGVIGDMVIHHIKNKLCFPEYANDIDNMWCLTPECHEKMHCVDYNLKRRIRNGFK